MTTRQTDTTTVEGELLDAGSAARKLGVSPSTLRDLVRSGRAPRPIQPGRRHVWRAAELAAWVKAGCPDIDSWTLKPGSASTAEGGKPELGRIDYDEMMGGTLR